MLKGGNCNINEAANSERITQKSRLPGSYKNEGFRE